MKASDGARNKHLEALVQQNPAAGNYEELGDLYLDEGKYAKARECYDKAITRARRMRIRSIAAVWQPSRWEISRRPPRISSTSHRKIQDTTSNRALGLLAHAYANTGQPADAKTYFQRALEFSTLSETYVNYATFLAAQNRPGGARMGRTRPRQQGGDAALSAASRAVVVQQGQGVVEASPEGRLTYEGQVQRSKASNKVDDETQAARVSPGVRDGHARVARTVAAQEPAWNATAIKECDRACLVGILDRYMNAIFTHDPKAVPALAADVRMTENTGQMDVGEGLLWRSKVEPTTFKIYVADPVAGQVALQTRLKVQGRDTLAAIRLKIDRGTISEIEQLHAGNIAPQAIEC